MGFRLQREKIKNICFFKNVSVVLDERLFCSINVMSIDRVIS